MSDPSDIRLSEVNEALLILSIRQHELTEQANLSESVALANQARFEALFEASPVGMYLVDSRLRIRLASREARRTFGDDQDVIGRDFVEVIHAIWPPRSADDIVSHFRATLETGEPYIVTEFAEERLDRKVREFYDWQIHRIVMPAGEFGVVCYFIDIADRLQAEQAVRNSEIRYRRLFEAAKDGILILNAPDGSITDANPIVVEMLGSSREELLRKHLWEVGLLPDAPSGKAMIRDLREKSYLRYEPITLKNAAGREIEVEVVANVYEEADRSIIQCNIRDITERAKSEKALVKALNYADDIVATLREPFLVLDDGLRVKTANRSFYDSFQVSKEETEGRFVYELGNGQWDIPGLRTLLDDVLARNESVHDYEVEHSFPTLGRKTMLLNARPFPPESKHPELILLAVQDVSAVRARADELAEAARHKDEFLATLAHELRNPLAPIRNAVVVLETEGATVPLVKDAAAVISRQTAIMVRLIDDLLDIARVSSNKLDIRKQRVELAAIVESALESSRPLIDEFRHELTVSLPPESITLDADPVRLAQVFLNLLNNSAKYTPPGGHIRLSVERRGNEAVVSVRDDGLGIPAEMLAHVFEMFTQVDRSIERSQGLGIGLTLVRRLVEMHDGSIEVHSEGLGKGSELIVRLPLASARQEATPKREMPEPKGVSGRRILVVDDNRDSADSLRMLLRLKGNEVRTAYDGLKALEVAEEFRPELVLLDIGLPKLNGYEVAGRIRKQRWGREVILVALTGWGQDEDRRRTEEAGFNLHIVKPLDVAELEKQLVSSRQQLKHIGRTRA